MNKNYDKLDDCLCIIGKKIEENEKGENDPIRASILNTALAVALSGGDAYEFVSRMANPTFELMLKSESETIMKCWIVYRELVRDLA